jgi:26S proteasome regulatory subunit (ATPase 3-interacting protein)
VSDLRQDITRLESEQEAIQARLASRHEDDTVSISPAERAKLETEWKQWQRQVGIRRRICCELWGRCSEVLPENVTAPELWVSYDTTWRFRCSSRMLTNARNLWGLKERSNKR